MLRITLGSSLKAIGQSTLTTLANTAITTAAYGGTWDKAFADLGSWEQWSGTVTAGIQGAAGSLTHDFFTQDGTGETIVAGTSIDTKALAGAASLSTTAITAGAEYAITGRTTLNLAALNFKYKANKREWTSSTGLLELRIGGAGTSLHLGTGGHRADVGTIAKTIGGRSDVLGVTRAKLAGEGSHALGVLNTSNYLAIGGMRQLSQNIWGRKVDVAFEDLGEDYGYYNHTADPNRIVINRRYNTNDREDVAVLAAGAAHEGQHRYDRTFHGATSEYSAHRSGAAVYLNLMHGLGLKGNGRLMQSITAGLMSEQSKQRNTGPVDHWRLTADGGLEFTGEGWLQNEEGLYLNTDGTTSTEPIPGLTIGAEGIETGLLNILNDGGTSGRSYDGFTDRQKQAAQGLMTGAGLGYVLRGDRSDTLANRYWNRNAVDGQTIRPQALASAGFEDMNRYQPQAGTGRRRTFSDWLTDRRQPNVGTRIGNAWNNSRLGSWWNERFGREELADEPWSPHQDFEPGSPEMQENLEYFQQYTGERSERFIAELDPSLQAIARALINQARYEDIMAIATEAYRSPERQDELYAIGRDENGNKTGTTVTDARGGESAHQYRLAIDLGIVDETGNWNWDYVIDPNQPDWLRLGEIGESYGFEWGGRWGWDHPHFQIPNSNLSQ